MRTGMRSWSFRYIPAHGAKLRRVTLGRYPQMGLADAREAAEALRASVRRGADPQAEWRATREAARQPGTTLPFDGLADLYLERYAKRRKASWKNDALYLRAHVRPAWGPRDAALLTRQDATRLLFTIADKAPVSANRVRSILMQVFAWAVDSGLLSESPMLGVKKPHKEGRGKTRTLRDDELRVLWRALDNAGLAAGTVAALRVLILLGQRPGEVAGMARDELVRFDEAREARWEIPAERMKARRPHVVPLPPFARELIAAARAGGDGKQGEGGFVFASRFADRQRLARHSLSQALRRVIERLEASGEEAKAVARLKADPPTPHDLRRTLASGLSMLGIPREDRQAVLAHVHDDVHAVYDRYDRAREKRVALEAWERHVRAVLANESSDNVVRLRR
jgi:integrase